MYPLKIWKCFLFFSLFGAHAACAQPLFLTLFGGASGYTGDLQSKLYNSHNVHLAFGANIKRPLNPYFSLRAGYTYLFLSASDANNGPTLQFRNLSFSTAIHEGSLVFEGNFFNLENVRFTPYVLAGIGFFHFNPYCLDDNSKKIYLHELGTEGQKLGIVKPYKLFQRNWISGGGLKYKLSETVTINYEIVLRKLNSDYIDDVSTCYYLPETSPYYTVAFRELGTRYSDRYLKTRGSPGHDDFYYSNSLGITLNIEDLLYQYRKSQLIGTRNTTHF